MELSQWHDEFATLPVAYKKAVNTRTDWLDQALAHQLPPDGDGWFLWWLNGGRGSGKTYCAAQDTWWEAFKDPKSRILVASATYNDLLNVCFSGPSGIIEVMPRELIANWRKQTCELELINGGYIRGISAENPERYRGGNFGRAWCDELAAWQYPETAFNLLSLTLRYGQRPRIIATTTPKPLGLLFDWDEKIENGDTSIIRTTASTYDNLENLAPTFRSQILQYENTDFGKQELEAELLDPSSMAVFPLRLFRLYPASKGFPKFQYIVQVYDTASSEKDVKNSDYNAMCVLGCFQPSEDSSMAVMVIDVWRGRENYPDLRERIVRNSQEIYGAQEDDPNFEPSEDMPEPYPLKGGKKVDCVLVENASSGRQLIQELKRTRIPIRGCSPKAVDKVQRAILASPVLAAGKVYLPESETKPGKPKLWLNDWIREVTRFPNNPIDTGEKEKHDDQTDAFSYGLQYLRDMGLVKIDFHPEPTRYADDEIVRKGYNPYAQ